MKKNRKHFGGLIGSKLKTERLYAVDFGKFYLMPGGAGTK